MLQCFQKQKDSLLFLLKDSLLGVGFISTNVGGVKELSNNNLCGFISDNDKELIDYIIAELSKKKNDRIIKSDACQNHVNKYSITEQINKFEKLLDEL